MTSQELFNLFKTKNILVVGDVMIDAYIWGKVQRISPEAPVPIVSFSKEENRLGGAANVALNLKALGANPILCSVVGADKNGEQFIDLLNLQGLEANGIIQSKNRITTVKTRVIGNQQQLLRIDAEQVNPLSESEENNVIESVQKLIDSRTIDAVIFEDYNKGILTKKVIQEIITICLSNNIITTVDPKKDNFWAYKNVTLFKPNLKELGDGVGQQIDFINSLDFEKSVEHLENELNNTISFITLSEHGVWIKKGTEKHHVPAHLRNIADVSGAGDTVISVATLCLTAGCSIQEIAEWSNLAGGLVCEKSGVVSIDPEQLKLEAELKQIHFQKTNDIN